MTSLLFVAPSLGGGGAEKHLVSLVHGLRIVAPDLELRVAVSRPGGTLEPGLPAATPLVSLLGPGTGHSATGRTLRSVIPLRRLLRELRPDMLCTFQDQSAVACLLATLGLRGAPKVVVGVQNTLSRKYSRAGGGSRWLFRAMARLYPRAARLVAPSRGVADDLRNLWPGGRFTVDVIPNAIRLEAPTIRDLPRLRPPKLVVACGRLVPQKGFGDLLLALARWQDPDVHLWILGEGPLRGQLTRRIAELGLAERVWLAGFQHEPAHFFAAADLFVLSSRWEGFGNVLVEALAAGTPVVATRCPHGPVEILVDGEFGRLVPPADPEALAGAMAELLADTEMRKGFAANGPRRAADFAPEAIARRYLALLSPLPEARR